MANYERTRRNSPRAWLAGLTEDSKLRRMLTAALGGPSLVSILSLPPLLLLYVAAHQNPFVLRHVPVFHLLGNAVTDAILSFNRTRTLGLSNNPTSVYLGLVYGVRCTLFEWSLLKLPPACGIALHVVSAPAAEIFASYSRRTISMVQIATVIALGLVIDRVVPMNSTALMLGAVASTLGVGAHIFATAQSREGTSLNIDATYSLASLVISLLFDAFFGPTLFGEKWWPPRPQFLLIFIVFGVNHFIKQSLHSYDPCYGGVSAIIALLVSSCIPGMRERISWFDSAAMVAAGACMLWDLQMTGSAATPNGGAKDPSGKLSKCNDRIQREQAQDTRHRCDHAIPEGRGRNAFYPRGTSNKPEESVPCLVSYYAGDVPCICAGWRGKPSAVVAMGLARFLRYRIPRVKAPSNRTSLCIFLLSPRDFQLYVPGDDASPTARACGVLL